MSRILTFSFDDAVVQDRRLVALFNKYGVKGTFNIASGLLDEKNLTMQDDPLGARHTISSAEVRELYAGHEVAAHTLFHRFLPSLTDKEIIETVEENRRAPSRMVGYEVIGMAYPCGGQNHDDRVASLVREHTGIKYARTIKSNGTFHPQEDLYRFNPTVWQGNYEELNRLWDVFLASADSGTQIFYVWGHSFEFDERGTWDKFEDFLKRAAGRDEIRYLTNREALRL